MTRPRTVLALLALAGGLTACASGGTANSPTNDNGAANSTDIGAATTSAAPDTGAPSALQFAAPSVGGGSIDFTSFAGKPVVLWFWAPT